MKIEVDTITAPACWASALVNDDRSGLDAADIALLDEWLSKLDGWQVVSTVDDTEPRFTWNFRLYGGGFQGGEVIDYVIHKCH